MDTLESAFSAKPPKELFHYTTQDGLLGILKSDQIWAGKIHYLNDSTEFQLALGIAKQLLDQKKADARQLREVEKIECLIEKVTVIELINVFVVSLSEIPDHLSQWRAYGGNGAGFSVGFRTEHLQKIGEDNGFMLGRCIYDENEQEALVNSLIDESLAEEFNTVAIMEHPSEPRRISILPTGGDFAEKLTMIAPIIKHASFAEEMEWRIISPPIPATDLKFRAGRSMLIPYYEYPLGEKNEYLFKVIVGPNPHPTLSALGTQMLLTSHKVDKCPVELSRIPYRTW